ncbi:MAG TPA: PIN domain-containing protein [Acidimicrobiales bacterium]|nr:PIN domain-containing protein [Acidimicrobiales bacterium]
MRCWTPWPGALAGRVVVARRRSSSSRPVPVAILDSEALSVLANPRERGASARRAQAVLEAIERRGGAARVPAPVLAEVLRTPARTAAAGRVLRRARVVPTDRGIAEHAGRLLEGLGLDSCHAVDAFVVATAASLAYAVILTEDPDDLRSLAAHTPGVAVQALP